jgi:hypothetical protein
MSSKQPGGQNPPKQDGPILFTQLDTVTTFSPPGQLGVRVGTVSGAINGTVTINSTFDPTIPPPQFQSNGQALVIDTDGDQILFQVAFRGQFTNALTVPPPGTPPDLAKVAGSFTAVYTASNATGKYVPIIGQAFDGVGVAVLPAQNPAIGAAFSQFTGSLSSKKQAKPK